MKTKRNFLKITKNFINKGPIFKKTNEHQNFVSFLKNKKQKQNETKKKLLSNRSLVNEINVC